MSRKIFFIIVCLISMNFFWSTRLFAASQSFLQIKQDYEKAVVINIIQQGEMIIDGQTSAFEKIQLRILSGFDTGKIVTITYGDQQVITTSQKVIQGDTVILLVSTNQHGDHSYTLYDKYRLNEIVVLLILFALLVIGIARWKGVGSLLGLFISLGVIILFIIPQLLKGGNPLSISIEGSLLILFVTTYIAHGFSKQTTVALFATFLSLMTTALLSFMFVSFTKLSGLGSEDITSLQTGATSAINLQGLLLAGVIIGTLGALNDVTITQSAAIFELVQINKSIPFFQLVQKGFRIGREHILSLVNTLVLAYAGTSLFIFIYLVLNPQHVPYWVILNSETLTDEIVGTITGSIGLILAVPIVTILASWVSLFFTSGGKATSPHDVKGD